MTSKTKEQLDAVTRFTEIAKSTTAQQYARTMLAEWIEAEVANLEENGSEHVDTDALIEALDALLEGASK